MRPKYKELRAAKVVYVETELVEEGGLGITCEFNKLWQKGNETVRTK